MKFWFLVFVVLFAKAEEPLPLDPAKVSEDQWQRGHEARLQIRQAMASDEVWRQLNHLRIRYEYRKLWRKRTTEQVTFVYAQAEPKWLKIRQVGETQDVTGFDGAAFWEHEGLSLNGMKRSLAAETCREIWLLELTCLMTYPDLRFADMGGQVIEGVALIQLAVFPQSGAQLYSVWVHPETKQVVQLCYWTEKKSGVSTTYFKYSDYRDVAGLMLPFKTTTEGDYPSERILATVEINPEGERQFWRKE